MTLLWVDSDEWTAGWIEHSGERRARGGREGGEKKEEENLVFLSLIHI